MFPLSELRNQIHSIPRNPNLIKFFRYAKLGENAGYGIDKMLAWERLTKGNVEFASDMVSSTITYWFGKQTGGYASGQAGGYVSGQVQQLIDCIRDNVFSLGEIQQRLGIKSRRYVREEMIVPAIEGGYVLLIGKAVDLYPLTMNRKEVDWSRFEDLADVMFEVAKEMEVEIVWGGHWKTFIDKCHFELREGNE